MLYPPTLANTASYQPRRSILSLEFKLEFRIHNHLGVLVLDAQGEHTSQVPAPCEPPSFSSSICSLPHHKGTPFYNMNTKHACSSSVYAIGKQQILGCNSKWVYGLPSWSWTQRSRAVLKVGSRPLRQGIPGAHIPGAWLKDEGMAIIWSYPKYFL